MNEEFDRDQNGEFHIMTAAEAADWDCPDAPLQLELLNPMNRYGQPRGSRSLINGEIIWEEADNDYGHKQNLHYDEQFKDREGH